MTTASNSSSPSRGWMLGFGFLYIFLGCLGLGMLVGLTMVSMVLFGVLMIVAGASHLVEAFKHKGWKASLWQVLIALLYIAGGSAVIVDPVLASVTITAILACVFIVIGMARILMALMLTDMKGWGWLLVAGIAALVLGIMILTQWPMSGLWFIGLIIAIDLIIIGWSYVFLGVATNE